MQLTFTFALSPLAFQHVQYVKRQSQEDVDIAVACLLAVSCVSTGSV